MQRSKRNSFKSHYKVKSTSSSKRQSKKSSKSNISHFNIRFSNNKLKKILILQRYWKKFYKNKIEKSIIKIQSYFRGYSLRKIFDEVFILNKKLECFFFIIKVTMFRHAINFDYLANKRINYYSDHKNTKFFLLLQRRIRYFLFMKKVKVLDKIGVFNNIYIKTKEYRTKIKSKMTSDKYLAKPIIKYHRPLSKIIMIQRNYLIHQNKNLKNKVIITKKDFYTKVNYDYKPLLLIQQKYKKRFNYLKENYKLKKHSKLLKKVNNKHHYIYHSYVVDAMYEVLLIQKNIKYFLFRRHSMVNLLKKAKIKKCEIKKQYEARGNVKKYFYEEFIRRLLIIIRKFFLSIYLKILRKNAKVKKMSSFGLSDYNYIDSVNSNDSNIYKRRGSLTSEAIKALKNRNQKRSTRKETFSISPNKISSPHVKQSNLVPNSEAKNFRDRNSKKKVTFKNDMKSSKKVNKNEEQIFDSPVKKNKKSANKGFHKHKSQNYDSNQNTYSRKGK